MKVIYSEECAKHAPKYEILSGNLVDYFESPVRIEIIKSHLQSFSSSHNYTFHESTDYGIDAILAVHDSDFVQYLKTAYDEWCQEGGDKNGILPEAFPHKNMPSFGRNSGAATAIAKAGHYCYDLSCCIMGGTWLAAYASAQVTISAAKALMEDCSLPNENGPIGVFALCRPPGHHATNNLCGGYCFLNNVAIVARLIISATSKKVAILDIDYHHGNGTQAIFYSTSNPIYVSLHGHPDYPWFSGHASETGEGEGEGYTVNVPLTTETDDKKYLEALRSVIQKIIAYEADFLVVSLGVDTFMHDPIAGFNMTSGVYIEIGKHIKSIGKPTLFVLEGGYHLETIGINVGNILEGFNS
ncbi:5500_t:CDS:2 [Paraglomus brasilianum]|uniref:5500_t:CDS:1 n=1 Tax=Paraglomus brasilianum TaxID=144538 RepID=A0A9N9C7Q2_9GLOM|nr:5500_t:CDS:2 [Paraglomus brasilianum]